MTTGVQRRIAALGLLGRVVEVLRSLSGANRASTVAEIRPLIAEFLGPVVSFTCEPAAAAPAGLAQHEFACPEFRHHTLD